MKRESLRIILAGYIVRGPLGGLAWHHLQYALGLAQLGHDVWFVEDSDDYPSCYDPARDSTGTDPSYGLEFARRVFDRAGLPERWAYHDAHASAWLGPAAGAILDACRSADLLVNLSGVNPLRPWLAGIPARALVDTDPVFTQVRHRTVPAALDLALRHTSFFSFAGNIGAGGSRIPDDGLPWRPTRQPVVLDAWPVTPGPAGGRFTTVMQWDSYKAVEAGGQRYGMKSDSFGPYLELPARAGREFEIALGGPTAPRSLLERNGWHLRRSLDLSTDPWTYQRYIQSSRGEFSVAKHGYVVSRSGWFSERTAGYLASGRPAVVEDTGFSDWLPTGAGLLPFSSLEEALAGIAAIDGRYDFHCRAARALAQEHFDARVVLPGLIEQAMGARRE